MDTTTANTMARTQGPRWSRFVVKDTLMIGEAEIRIAPRSSKLLGIHFQQEVVFIETRMANILLLNAGGR